MATLTSTKIKNTYDALLKASDNDAIGSSAKQITDGLGNGTPLYISTTQIGIGVTPEATYDLHVYSNAKVGGNLTITGDLTVNGTTTTVGTDTLSVKDPLIVLANNNTSADSVDIGFYGKYAPSGTTLYAGLFRDTGDNKFKLFRNLEEEPTTTVNTSGTGYTVATLVANLEGNVTGDITGNADTATALETARTIQVSGDVAGSASFDGTADINISTTIQPNSVALGTDTTGNYVATISGTANEITVSGSGSESAAVTISLPSSISVDVTGDLTGDVYNADGTIVFNTGDNSNDAVLSNGVRATTQSQGDNSTKLATTAYVDSAIGGQDTLAEVLANGNTTGGTDIAVSANDDITFTSTSKAIFGGSLDLQVYSDGSNNYIDSTSNELRIRSNDLRLLNYGTAKYITADSGADVSLYYNNSKKFETTSTGVQVTGSNLSVLAGSGATKLQFVQTNGNWKIEAGGGTNQLVIHSESLVEDYVTIKGGGVVQLNDYGSGSNTGTAAYNLSVDSSGNIIETAGGVVDGSGTATFLPRWIDSNTLGDSILNQSSNDIIIGYNSNSTHSFEKTFATGHATGNRGAEIHFGMDDGGGNVGMRVINSASSNASFNAQHIEFHTHEGGVSVGKRMEILSTGNSIFYNNIGIGTSSPDSKLHVDSGVSSTSDWGNLGIISDFPINNTGRIYTSYLLQDSESIKGAGIGLAYDGTGYKMHFGTASTTSSGLSTQMTIDRLGNLGIGTTSPGTFFPGNHNLVVGDGNADSAITVYANPANTSYLLFADGTSGSSTYTAQVRYNHSTNHMEFATNNSTTAKMTLDDTGNVGIGTDSPAQKLEVIGNVSLGLSSTTTRTALLANTFGYSTSYKTLTIGSTGTNYQTDAVSLCFNVMLNQNSSGSYTGDGSELFFRNVAYFKTPNSSNNGYLNPLTFNNGNIGISTTSPSYKLQVNGTAYINETLYVNGATTIDDNLYVTTGNVGIGVTPNSSYSNLQIKTPSSAYGLDLVGRDAGSNSESQITFWNAAQSSVLAAIYNSTSNLYFYTNGDNRMIINSSGNILINATSKYNSYPSGFLTQTIATDAGDVCPILELVGNRDASAGNQNAMIQFFNKTSTAAEVGRITSSQGSATNSGQLEFYTANAGTLTEKMRITSGGEVLIGATNSDIGGSVTGIRFNQAGTILASMDETADTTFVAYFDRRGTNNEGTAIAFAMQGFYKASIGVIGTSANVNDGGMTFNTLATNGGFAKTERMRITSDGDILFGCTSLGNDFAYFEAASSNRRILNVGSSTTSSIDIVNFRNPNGIVGGINTDGFTTSFSSSSDYRLKENVVEMTDALDRVSNLKPSRFNFIGEEKTVDGFLAHEVQDIVPEAISGEKDAVDEKGNPIYQGIDQSKLVPLLVGAIQELQKRIEILENK